MFQVRLFRKLNAEVKDICNDPDMAGNVNLRFETEWDGVFYVNGELSRAIFDTRSY